MIAGKDKGRRGNILRVFPAKQKVLVEGMNIAKKHVKPKKQGEKGQVIEVAVPLPLSNVQVFCQKCTKGSRIGYRVEGGEKVRICRRCSTPLQ